MYNETLQVSPTVKDALFGFYNNSVEGFST
jgi:hypothetical protein